MDAEVLKAINNISKRINEVEKRLDDYFSNRHEENSSAITDTDMAVMELAGIIDEIKDQGGQGNG